jgi:hypothetical protein
MSQQTSGRGERRKAAPVSDVVIESPGGQLVTLSKWDGELPAARSIRPSDGLKSSVAAAIKPGMEVLSHAQAARNAYTVVFQPRVTEGLANHTMTLMQGEQGFYLTAMETVVTKNGKTVQRIAGNGQLVTNNVQRVAHLSMAALQVAAVVTAQAYLAEIDKKLTAIKECVDAIREWLETKESSRLHGNYQYLQDIAGAIRAGGLNDTVVTVYLNQIEQIERDSLEIDAIYMSQLRNIHTHLPQIETSFHSSGAKEDMQKLDEALKRWRRFADGCMAVQQLRMVAVHLRSLLVADAEPGSGRLKSCHATLAELRQLWADFSQALGKKVDQVDSYFDKGISAAERREFRKRMVVSDGEIRKNLSDVRKFHTSIESALEEKRLADETGLALLVSTDTNGSITDLARIVLQPSSMTSQ